MIVDGMDQVTMNRTYGKLYLVDLAGSERVKETESTGQRLVEANFINKRLSALGDVMRALSERGGKHKDKKAAGDGGGGHIRYRNSKLTYLLQDALGGNSKTMMVVNVTPSDMYMNETLASLEFARRVRKVQLDPKQSTQNAALQKYKIKLADMKEQAKATTEKLKASLRKVQGAVRERDQVILQLTEKLKEHRRIGHQKQRSKQFGTTPMDSWTDDRAQNIKLTTKKKRPGTGTGTRKKAIRIAFSHRMQATVMRIQFSYGLWHGSQYVSYFSLPFLRCFFFDTRK